MAIGLFLVLLTSSGMAALHQSGGRLTYALDDAYIHMAVAKHVALNGAWSIHQSGFSASSSSPLWTALVAALFSIVGVHDVVPLLMNVCLSIGVLLLVLGMLAAQHVRPWPAAFVTVTLAVTTPLAAMVLIGMEHVLQILLTLLTTHASAAVVGDNRRRVLAGACIAAALLVATRYEGLFVVSGCVLVLVLSARYAAAAMLTLSSVVPVLVIGAWNVSHGWFFLPASVLMKQTVLAPGHFVPLIDSMVVNATQGHAPAGLIVLLIAGVVTLVIAPHGRRVSGANAHVVVFVVATLEHLLLAKFGWLYRYEAYLVALGVVSIGAALCETDAGERSRAVPSTAVVGIVSALVVLTMGDRSLGSLVHVATVAGHISRQHARIAAFVDRNYAGQPIVLNDIGVVSYRSTARVIDVMGLGSLEAARLRRDGQFTAANVNAWLDREGASIAVIYDDWFAGKAAFQRDWLPVAAWSTEASDASEGRVAFYARDEGRARRLRAALQDFEPELAHGTLVTYAP